MFAEHQKRIGVWARQSPNHLKEVAWLAFLSAHQPFIQMPAQMQDVRTLGPKASCLFGWKQKAYAWWQDNHEDMFVKLTHAWLHEQDWAFADFALYEVLKAPGFGYVKGGFFIQMAFGVSGCLDTHNLVFYNVSPKAVKPKPQYTYQDVVRYNSLVQRLGWYNGCDNPSETIWNEWCENMAKRWPMLYKDAYTVSALHCEALQLG